MQVPKPLAASVLAGATLSALAASHLTTPAIGYGPVFLLICAFGAWFVGNRLAIMLLLFIAAIQVLSGHPTPLQDESILKTVDVALKVSSALAVVLMLGVARTALEIEWRFARIDPLTGALNRKAFFEAVEAETGRADMAVLVFADVDGLKGLNDRLGHEVGDGFLRDFAGRVSKAIRKDDLFARIGGDEFVIFLRVQDAAAANTVAVRLNRVLNLDPQEGETDLKCSLGILVLPAGSKSIDIELRQADTLMYHAKRERAGLMMAFSVKGDMQELMPFAPKTNSIGKQRTAVRAGERYTALGASDRLFRPNRVA